jgi:hypothetical protein
MAVKSRRPTIGDYVKITKGVYRNKTGFILRDDKDYAPYKVQARDGVVMPWLDESCVKIIPLMARKNKWLVTYGYEAKFQKDGSIKVGCQTVVQSEVLRLAEEIKRRQKIKSQSKPKKNASRKSR